MRAIDTRLGVDAYARVWFRTTERLAAAQAAARVSTATEHDRMMYEHVLEWERSILHVLRVSSVSSRYTKGVNWLLFAPSVIAGFCPWHYAPVKLSSDMQSAWGRENGVFRRRACNKCLAALTQTVPRMPEFALVNGMWGRPQPLAIVELTHAEKMVTQRARLYIGCKRISSSAAPAGAPHDARPRAVTKNVIAYPQRPEQLLLRAGLVPADLHKILVVQFVGCDRRVVREDLSLRISVARLRAASDWLTRVKFSVRPRRGRQLQHQLRWCVCGSASRAAESTRV